MSFWLKSSHLDKLMCRPSGGPSMSIKGGALRIADILPASSPSSRNQALKSRARQSSSASMAAVIFIRPKKRIKGPVDHLAELLIVMTDGLKGATREDGSHSPKKPMEGVLGNE